MNANRYFHMVDKPCTELPNPEAAVLPALVSVFDSEVTSLGPMKTRSAWVCAAFRQAILSCHACMTDFPPTKPEARGTNPTRIFTVRHRLFRISLASALLRIRLRLSWLSFSPFEFLARYAEDVSPGVACRQTTAPHASRVERTRLKPIKPEPHGRDFLVREILAQSLTRFVCYRTAAEKASPRRLLHRHGLSIAMKKKSEARSFRIARIPNYSIVRECHWIERWDYSDMEDFSETNGA